MRQIDACIYMRVYTYESIYNYTRIFSLRWQSLGLWLYWGMPLPAAEHL